MIIHLLGCGHQDECRFVIDVVLMLVSERWLGIDKNAHQHGLRDLWEVRAGLRPSHLSFGGTHLLFDMDHFRTEINEFFFLGELSNIVRATPEGGLHHPTRANSTSPSSAVVDNLLRRADAIAYSSS